MELTLSRVFLIIFASGSFSENVSGLEIKVAHFQLDKQNPALRKCIIERVQPQEGYDGARVSEKTGECQGVNQSLGMNKTKESGYTYAKKVNVEKEDFQPPLEISHVTWVLRKLPGVLNTGATLDVIISNPEESPDLISIGVYEQNNIWRIFFELRGRDIVISTGDGNPLQSSTLKNKRSAIFKPKKRAKISFLVQDGSVTVLVDDEELKTLKLFTTDATMLNEIFMFRSRSWYSQSPILVHSIRLTRK